MTSIRTRLTDRYGLAHPIACAGMAFVTLSPRLPVAVCEAGALGAFAAGPFPLDFIRANLTAIAEQTTAPLHLNFITPFITDEHIELAVELPPAVVSFHWALPGKAWIDRLHTAGIDVWQQVGKVDDARLCEVVREMFPLSPAGIIKYLDLRRPIYRKTAAGGHFGRDDPEFTWEKTGQAAKLAEAVGTVAAT